MPDCWVLYLYVARLKWRCYGSKVIFQKGPTISKCVISFTYERSTNIRYMLWRWVCLKYSGKPDVNPNYWSLMYTISMPNIRNIHWIKEYHFKVMPKVYRCFFAWAKVEILCANTSCCSFVDGLQDENKKFAVVMSGCGTSGRLAFITAVGLAAGRMCHWFLSAIYLQGLLGS